MSLMSRRLYYLCITVLVSLAYIETATGQSTDIVTTIATTWITTEVDPTTTKTAATPTAAPTTAVLTTALPDLNAPANVTIADVPSDNEAFTVSWDHDPDGRLMVTYDVIVTFTNGSEVETVTTVKSVVNITNKTPGQEYDVTVVALDDRGGMENSDVETFRLQPNIVESLLPEDSSNTSVTAVWDPPLNSVFDSYNISCSNGTASPMIIMNDDTREASCTDVPSGRLEIITVTTVSGSRGNSDSLGIWSKPNTVEDLQGDVVTTDSVSVTWSLPDDHIPSYYYIISCSDGTPVPDNITNEATTATCSPVRAGSLVTVNVTTHSGAESNTDSTTVRGKPNSVDELTEEGATTDSVTASWKRPGGDVTHYDISCSTGNPRPPLVTDDGRSTEYTASCEISLPGTECTMTVTSVSDDVDGDSRSIAITARPIPPVLEEAASTVTSITVEWVKPNSVVEYYIIDCPNGTASSSNITATDGRLSASCTGLTVPGDLYYISVQSQSNDKFSDPETKTINALPASVTLTKSQSRVDTVSATWMDPGGVYEEFNIQCESAEPLQETISYDPDASSYKAECNVAIPGDLYNMTVVSRSGIQNSDDSTIELRASPEPVETFEVTNYTDNGVTLSWMMKAKCENDNCVWTSFEISYNSTLKDNIPKASTSLSVDSLTPGAEYHFSISVISFDEPSTSENTVQRLRPSSVESLEEEDVTQRSLTVKWDRPVGIVTGYDTTIESMEEGRGGGETGGFDNNLSDQKHTATFENLTPGLSYEITVCTESYNERCITRATITIDTLPSLPSAPLEVLLQDEDIHTVIVTFSEPEFPNGDIMAYIIRYSGVKDGSDDQEQMDKRYTPEGDPPYSDTIYNLVAGYTYTFQVSAENKAGEGPYAEESITLDQAEPEESTAEPTDLAVPESVGVKSFTVTFLPDWFSHCNGELKTYSVFVVEEGGNETIGHPPRSYNEAQSQKTLPVYQAKFGKYPFPPDYASCTNLRKRRNAITAVSIEIGDGTCIGDDDNKYCNGELHGNREYKVKYRACNEVGCSETPYSGVIKTDLNKASWLVPLLFIIIILVIALAVFTYMKEKKHPGSMTKYMKRPKSGVDNPGFEKPMRREGDTRLVRLAEFGTHLEEMSKDSDYLFSEEYNDLRPVGKNQSTDAAQLEVNRVKNRFSNILPYDHTRVHLSPIDDEEGSDYINANYMLGYLSQREYIACQGPLQSTEEDMWRLVWEQSSSIIVMVTQLMENGKIKCHQYWPDEGEGPVRYGEIVVNPSGVEHEDLWTKRNFQLTKGPVTRHITHFNFLAWPDHGVPEKPDDLIKFVHAVRECKKMDGKPTVVHCSAGVGRTGTFISLDNLMTAMKDKDEVDIFGMVRKMRMNRCLMVQTESQYIFIHQCVMALLEGPSPSDSEALYENVNGNGAYFQEALI